MYQGKHGNADRGRAPRRPRGQRSLVLVLVLVLVLGAAIGGTIAYLTTSTTGLTNTFTPASVDTGITEEIRENAKTSIVINNTGTTAAYIRVMLVGNTVGTVDGKEVVTGGFDVNMTGKLGTDWVKGEDGYYYYTRPVAAGDATTNLLADGKIELAENQTVTVLSQAIQAEPTSVVTSTWNVKLDTNGYITGTN